jgi:hypothetical protein
LEPNDASTAPLCSQCAADRAESDLAARQTESARSRPDGQERARTMRRVRTGVFWALALLAIGIIAWRAPSVYSATQPPKPIRTGIQSTNKGANECIANLWIASGKLPEGTAAATGLTCPASGRPYSVTQEGAVTVVACPNPEKHGLRSLTVRSVTLVPEVK